MQKNCPPSGSPTIRSVHPAAGEPASVFRIRITLVAPSTRFSTKCDHRLIPSSTLPAPEGTRACCDRVEPLQERVDVPMSDRFERYGAQSRSIWYISR